jgi:hypothetical protein
MASEYGRYAAEVEKKLSFRPVWPLGVTMRLGAIGRHQNGVFEQEGDLTKLGILVEPHSDQSGNWGLASGGSVKASLNGGAKLKAGVPGTSIADAGAAVDLTFSKEHAVFLRAESVVIHSIENLGEVADAVLRLDAEGQWREGRSVISHLIEAERCLVLIAGGSDSTATLRVNAEAPITPGQLAKADAGLSIENSNGMAQSYEQSTPSTPLYKAQRPAWRPRGGKQLVQVNKRGKLRPSAPRPADDQAKPKHDVVPEWVPVRSIDED